MIFRLNVRLFFALHTIAFRLATIWLLIHHHRPNDYDNKGKLAYYNEITKTLVTILSLINLGQLLFNCCKFRWIALSRGGSDRIGSNRHSTHYYL